MRLSVEIFLFAASLALTAHAFDSAEWLAQRAMLDLEAERLRDAYAKYSTADIEPAESIVVPVESYSNGAVKTSIAAKRARFFVKEGFVWGEGVEIRQFRRDGSLESKIDADNCVVDRDTRSGWIEGHAHAEFKDEAVLDGDRVYFSAMEEYLKIYSGTVLKADGKELRSRRADYDHQNGVAMFDGDVELRGREKKNDYTLDAGQAFAFLSGTNELRRVVALGGVAVRSGDREGFCDRAVFTKRDSKIVMYGDGESVTARLVDNSKRRSEVEGVRITFWTDSEQVEVVDSKVSLDTNGLKLPKGPEGR